MAVIEFKKCRLSYLIADPGYEDENGDYHIGETRWDGDIECNVAPTGSAKEVKFDDGSIKVCSYTVSLPANSKHFAIGDRVRIKMLGGEIREFEVKDFKPYQLQNKMWI